MTVWEVRDSYDEISYGLFYTQRGAAAKIETLMKSHDSDNTDLDWQNWYLIAERKIEN